MSRVLDSSPRAVRDSLTAQCAQVLASYRKNCASPSSAGQLILPECMKLLPLYANCILRADAVCGGQSWAAHSSDCSVQRGTGGEGGLSGLMPHSNGWS